MSGGAGRKNSALRNISLFGESSKKGEIGLRLGDRGRLGLTFAPLVL